MTTYEVRKKFLEYFKSQGHAVIPSSPIIPQNDPTTLFTGSGMQPMVPYLLGQTHPSGTRITDSQICFRAQDIEEVGDNRHTTFFEMLGNWSLGDFFKNEQIPWMWGFLTDKNVGLGLSPERLYFTCFKGSPEIGIPKDTESSKLWQDLFKGVGIDAKIGENPELDGMKGGERIFYYPDKKNWWSRAGVPANMPVGEPGGPDTEMFYDFDPSNAKGVHEKSEWASELCHVNCDCGRFVEIGNNVFMEYIRTENGYEKLKQQNVDFGGGLERLVAATNDDSDVFNIDVFSAPKNMLENLSHIRYGTDKKTTYAMRVILDHIRVATFLIADGVIPSNKDQGYFTRRLIRRSVRFSRDLGIHKNFCADIASEYINTYKSHYDHLEKNKEIIVSELLAEEERFRQTLEDGLKYFERGEDPFVLYTTYGFPIELTEELAKEKGVIIDRSDFDKKMEEHQKLSRAGGEQKFKGGLADTSEATVRLHTAHHLLLAALREVLGDHVHQRGSNITAERLRMDFAHPAKVTPEELEKAEKMVNKWINEKLPMTRVEIPREEAEKVGAQMEFGAKYPDVVSVYFVGENLQNAVSKEFCGGPHVKNTSELSTFKILKEEAVAQGVRRIKAVLS